MKREKMTRRKRRENFGTIEEWLIHKANLRRKKEEEDRKWATERMNKEFDGY